MGIAWERQWCRAWRNLCGGGGRMTAESGFCEKSTPETELRKR